MDPGGVGVVEQGQGPVRGDRLVALAQPLGRRRELAVRGRDQRVDRQEPPGVLRHALPVAGRLVQLDEPEVRRAGVAVARGQGVERGVLGLRVGRGSWGRRRAARRRSPGRRIPGRASSGVRGRPWPSPTSSRPRASPPSRCQPWKFLGWASTQAERAAESASAGRSGWSQVASGATTRPAPWRTGRIPGPVVLASNPPASAAPR